ncbi:MAG: HDOD domain-containing protein, partial [Bdellovibrionales bacterium]|nr:HDOD domain-containing protein [Bdellovibrionales bacterium]
ALKEDGDFPASAAVVTQLQKLTSNPDTTPKQVADLIVKEPSLGGRILSIVNSSFYRRSEPIMTVSHAVVQLGIEPVVELCSSFVLLQRFVARCDSSNPLEFCLRRTLLTSALVSVLNEAVDSTEEIGVRSEQGYLVGSFSELGLLLVGYYFPEILTAAQERAATKEISFADSVNEICGLTPIEISIAVLEALSLPTYYQDILRYVEQFYVSALGADAIGRAKAEANEEESKAQLLVATLVYAAQRLSDIILGNGKISSLDDLLFQLEGQLHISVPRIREELSKLPDMLSEHSAALELPTVEAPPLLIQYLQTPQTAEVNSTKDDSLEFIQPYVEQIRNTIESGSSVSETINKVMETLTERLDFDRAVLLLYDEDTNCLKGQRAMGLVQGIEPDALVYQLAGNEVKDRAEVIAFTRARPVFKGKALLEKGWPFCVFPVGLEENILGVLYADQVEDASTAPEIGTRDQVIIGVLCDLLNQAVQSQ